MQLLSCTITKETFYYFRFIEQCKKEKLCIERKLNKVMLMTNNNGRKNTDAIMALGYEINKSSGLYR
jgi:hypothetical protein